MLPFRHPFTAIFVGPTSCGKTRFVFRLLDHVDTMIEPAPSKVVYCYGEFQELFRQYPRVTFHHGLPDIDDFDGREPTLLIIDDLMQESNKSVANLFTSSQHQCRFPRTEPVSQEQICTHHESECSLHDPIQESQRCQSVCESGTSDVSEVVAVCHRSI